MRRRESARRHRGTGSGDAISTDRMNNETLLGDDASVAAGAGCFGQNARSPALLKARGVSTSVHFIQDSRERNDAVIAQVGRPRLPHHLRTGLYYWGSKRDEPRPSQDGPCPSLNLQPQPSTLDLEQGHGPQRRRQQRQGQWRVSPTMAFALIIGRASGLFTTCH